MNKYAYIELWDDFQMHESINVSQLSKKDIEKFYNNHKDDFLDNYHLKITYSKFDDEAKTDEPYNSLRKKLKNYE